MNKLQKLITSIAFMLFICAVSQAAAVKVNTWPLGDSGIESGIVRVVFTPTTDFGSKEIAVVLHETETDFSWNASLSATMLNHYTVDGAPMLKHIGYDGNIPNWNTTDYKEGEKGKKVAVWLAVNVAADTSALYVQIEGETTVTKVATALKSRESTDGKGPNTATMANYCTLFFNNVGGNTAACVEVVDGATVVDAITPYNFSGVTVGLAQKQATSISVTPTIVSNDILKITAKEAISSVSVLTISGQEVLTLFATNEVNVRNLNSGIYLVKVITVSGEASITKILKK